MEIPPSTARERPRERRRSRAPRVLRWLLALLVLGVVFLAGLVVGRAVEAEPDDGTQTLVRTLVPTTLTPRETVTVTVSNP